MTDDNICSVCGCEVFDDEPATLIGEELTHNACLHGDVDDDPSFDSNRELEKD